jgi:hypothetical protein
MLWGRSGNCCAYPECRKQLAMDIEDTDDISIVGEEAHIVGKEKDAPRGNSDLTNDQRDKYDNLILLCSIHHKVIDDHPEIYTVDKLRLNKQEHERWVAKNLQFDEVKQKEDEFYAGYLDNILGLLKIDHYKAWTSALFGGDQPTLRKEIYDKLKEAVSYILSRVWFYRYQPLKDAFINVKNVINDLLLIFDHYSTLNENETIYYTEKFYRIKEWDPEKYNKLGDKYDYHVKLVEDLTLELTRALNYLFDQVRKYLFPPFRITEGVLLIEVGPFMDFSWRTYRVEYRGEERKDKPYPGWKKFLTVRHSRDIAFGEGNEDIYTHPFMNK